MTKFATACKLSFEDWVTEIPDFNDLPEPDYSKNHIKKMKNLFDKMRENKYHHFTSKTFKIILVAAVLFSLFTFYVFANPSSRKYIIEKFEEFGIFTLTEQKSDVVPDIEIGYVPQGFDLVNEIESKKYICMFYESSDGKELTVQKSASTSQIAFNNEDGQAEEIIIGNITYTYVTNSSEYKHILWTENNYIYSIDGTLSKEELLKIAINLN